MITPSTSIDLSIIITCHSEGILIHKTLASVARALNHVEEANFSQEIIVHVDNPTPVMEAYLTTHKETTLKNVRLFTNAFKDLGSSRNYAIAQAKGEYVATIDADDLMSENWLHDALLFLKQQKEPTIAHSEMTIEFEGSNGLIIKHGEIDRNTDTLLSVYANRWNSVIVAPRQLLVEEPYAPNSPGYGYEDWHLNSRLIHRGIHNLLVPHTAIFVRRKNENSEWLRQIQSMAVLRKNPLLSFPNIRAINTNPFTSNKQGIQALAVDQKSIRQRAKNIIVQYPLAHRITRHIKHVMKRRRLSPKQSFIVPAWLQKEWYAQHSIEKQLFPTQELIAHINEYDSLTPEHYVAGSVYKQIVDSLQHDTYDYLFFVPWLIKGGADEFTINYANEIASANPAKRVIVVATMPVTSQWQTKLHGTVDFLDLGQLTQGIANEIKYRLMSHIIENANVSHLHIINSEFGYDFVRLHRKYIEATDKKVIVTAFSQSVDKEGRLYGYSHTHVPFIYEMAALITSDNQSVLTMWENEYGFDASKLLVHRQPVKLTAKTPSFIAKPRNGPLRILWAARVAPEKQPELLAQIGTQIKGIAHIDAYGTVEPGCEQYIQNLPPTVTYKGSFDGLASLPLGDYDYLLYTSLFDGMPNTILQAAEAGVPIISSAVGGIPEFITEQTGILIEDIRNPQAYSDAIISALQDPSRGKDKAKNAYVSLKKDFSPDLYKDRIKTFLKQLEY